MGAVLQGAEVHQAKSPAGKSPAELRQIPPKSRFPHKRLNRNGGPGEYDDFKMKLEAPAGYVSDSEELEVTLWVPKIEEKNSPRKWFNDLYEKSSSPRIKFPDDNCIKIPIFMPTRGRETCGYLVYINVLHVAVPSRSKLIYFLCCGVERIDLCSVIVRSLRHHPCCVR